MNPPFFLLLLCLPFGLSAQFSDDFADGSFVDGPFWSGNADRFAITAGELQLLDTDPSASNIAYLSTGAATSLDDLTTWSFFVRLEFGPSANNFARVYLSATTADLSQATNGYFLEVGGGDDQLTLFRQDGDATTALLTATPGALADAPAVARVRISRDPDGQWQLAADYSGGNDYQTEGTVTDNTYASGGFFGFYCRYTTTRSDKFFFDDVGIDPLFSDTEPPLLLSVEALSETQLQLSFDEPLDADVTTDTDLYEIDNGIGAPTHVLVPPGAPATVQLTLGNALVNQTEYTLSVSNITDTNGNSSGLQSIAFTFLDIQPAAAGDVLINEIMADPTPAVSLPAVEYLELFNQSDKVIQLSDLFFDSGAASLPLSSYLLSPGSYVILAGASDETALSAFGPTVTIDGNLGLTNGGDILTLANATGDLIEEIEYDDRWYDDADRDEGGFSLERIDPAKPGQCSGNWRASLSPAGGTPGTPNSVLGLPGDQSAPVLLSAAATIPGEILLTFDEELDPGAATLATNYQLDAPINILDALLLDPPNEVLLVLDEQLPARTLIELTVAAGLSDCLGNTTPDPASLTLALGETAAPGDLIFTEIMANPNGVAGLPETEYVELYNPGEKFLEIGGLRFSNGGNPRILPPFLLLPGQYVLLADAETIEDFPGQIPRLGLFSFPSLSNGGDELTLETSSGEVLVALTYDSRWYADDEKASGGWSLELVQLSGPATCRHNWRASVAPAGGSPGQVNSVNGEAPDNQPVDLLAVIPAGDTELRLDFSRSLNPNVSADLAAFALTPPQDIVGVEVLAPGYEQIRLSLAAPLMAGERYTMRISEPLSDCLGNGIGQMDTLAFGLPQAAESLDFIVNEILFFAEPGGEDFVELYNRSDKVINLKGTEIINTQKERGNRLQVVVDDYLLLPGRYAVLTGEPADIQSRYQTGGPATFLKTDLPTFDSDAGNVTLRAAGITIDSFDYTDDLHFSLLSDERGVSLERLSPDAPTGSTGNWHSAAATAGFATPGLPNSVLSPTAPTDDSVISIPVKTFSPDGDGFQETLSIFYQADQPGYVLNLHIFDAQGRPVRQLINNQSLDLADNGSFKWDGADSNGQKARIGIYILWIELFRPDGTKIQRKETCVLAGPLD